jgi:hypothetical protein
MQNTCKIAHHHHESLLFVCSVTHLHCSCGHCVVAGGCGKEVEGDCCSSGNNDWVDEDAAADDTDSVDKWSSKSLCGGGSTGVS